MYHHVVAMYYHVFGNVLSWHYNVLSCITQLTVHLCGIMACADIATLHLLLHYSSSNIDLALLLHSAMYWINMGLSVLNDPLQDQMPATIRSIILQPHSRLLWQGREMTHQC